MRNNALIVGIDRYDNFTSLYGCVSDARSMHAVLEFHGDGQRRNFDCDLLVDDGIDRSTLLQRTERLFSAPADVALFYFAGHGHVGSTGGRLLTSEALHRNYDGVSLDELLILATRAKAKNKVILLDSCHSGAAGTSEMSGNLATLAEGLTILTASMKDQQAAEGQGGGVFTTLLVDALKGGAANLAGHISAGSIYAYIDQSLGLNDAQRPVFKSNVSGFASLREVEPPIALSDLRRITEFFQRADQEYELNPTYEPEMRGREPDTPAPIKANTEKFALLQKYNRLNMLVPFGASKPNMWHAAMEGKRCRLTPLGEHYRRLVANGRI